MTEYRTVGSLQAVKLDDGSLLLQSDHASCRIEGSSADLVANAIVPALARWCSFAQLCERTPGYSRTDIQALLDSLVGARLVVTRAGASDIATAEPVVRVMADLGLGEAAVAQRLARLGIGVVGAGSAADAIVGSLEAAAIGRIVTFGGEGDRGGGGGGEGGAAASPGAPQARQCLPLSKEAIAQAAAALDLMIVLAPAMHLASRHWANQASLATGCPAIYVDISATQATIGPTVLPGETGCYLCFRMRRMATRDAFTEAMAHERHLDALRAAAPAEETFPGLEQIAVGVALSEAFRLLFGPLVPALANAVFVVDMLEATFERHEVLRHPDCPQCRGIDSAVRVNG